MSDLPENESSKGGPSERCGPRICPHCGIVAPVEKVGSPCVNCATLLPAEGVWCPELGEERFWVGVKCTFVCRVCGHRSPLDHLDVDGSILCAKCGIEQKFEPAKWGRLIEFAHGVGDLAGSFAARRRTAREFTLGPLNPYAQVGKNRTFATIEQDAQHTTAVGQHAMTLSAAPGHPLCEQCHRPLEISRLDDNGITLICRSCGDERSYRRPASDSGLSPRLLAVIAEESRAKSKVTLERDGIGAILLRCPNCSADLAADSTTRILSCRYCGATSLLAEEHHRALGGREVEPSLWWMLFSGPSSARQALLAEISSRTEVEPSLDEPKARRRMGCRGALLAAGGLLLVVLAVRALLPTETKVPRHPPTPKPTVSETPATAAPEPTPAPAAEPSAVPTAERDEPAPEVPFGELSWSARVTKARGKPVAPGQSCEFRMRTNGRRMARAWLECGSAILYDSKQSFSGMVRFHVDVGEVRGKATGSWVYTVEYGDTGSRRGRPQLQAESQQRILRAFDENAPGFSVELSMSPESTPRSGPAFFREVEEFVPTTMDLVTVEASPTASVRVGAACSLWYSRHSIGDDGARCKVRLRCGKKNLYDTTGPGVHSPCELDERGGPKSLADRRTTEGDGDPMLVGGLVDGPLVLRDDPPRGEWSVRLEAKP